MTQAVRRKKNKKRNLLLLVLLAVLCIGAYVLVHHVVSEKENGEDATSEESETEELMQLSTDDAVKLEYKYENQTVTLVKEKDTWKLSDDTEYPVDQDLVASMLSVFSNTNATKTIAMNQKDAQEYGMDAPVLTASLELKDKTKMTVTVGMAGIGDSSEEYYVTVSGKEGIYMASSNVYTPFQYKKSALGTIEETPSISSDGIYAITVKKGSKAIFEAKKDLASESVNYDNWMIGAPYDSEVAGDTTSLSSLASNYTSYSFTQNVASSKENDAKYGLDQPAYTVEIKYTKESEEDETEASPEPTATATAAPTKTEKKSFTLSIGKTDSDGNYYVKTSDTKYIYLMSASDIKTYIDINAFSEVSTTVFSEALNDVKKLKVKTSSNTASYTLDTEKEDEDLTSLYEAITALSYKGEIDKEAKVTDKVLVVEITYGDSGQYTKKLEFTEQDSNYDQVTVDGATSFVVDKRDVESIIDKIK